MSDFSLHHRAATSAAPSGFSPRTGELVSAKFSEDDQWYRARVKRASGIKKEALLYFIDYGNEETLPFSRIRPLDQKFKGLEGQAKEARLRWVLRCLALSLHRHFFTTPTLDNLHKLHMSEHTFRILELVS